jgi:hypothetical protein
MSVTELSMTWTRRREGFRLGDALRTTTLHKPKCWRKQRWASQGAAEAHLRSLLRQDFVKDVARLNVFRCKECGTFHVGRKKYD